MVSFFVLVVSENLGLESQEKFKGKTAINLTVIHHITIKLTFFILFLDSTQEQIHSYSLHQ